MRHLKVHKIYSALGILPLVAFDPILRTLLNGVQIFGVLVVYFRKLKLPKNIYFIAIILLLATDPLKSIFIWERLPQFIFILKYLMAGILFFEFRNLKYEQKITVSNILITIVIITGILGIIIGNKIFLNGTDRYMGLTISPTAYALYAAVTFAMCVSMYIVERSKWYILYACIILILLYLTGSRQPFLGCLIFIFFEANKRFKLISIGLGVFILGLIKDLGIRQIEIIFNLFKILPNISLAALESIKDGSLYTRLQYIKVALDSQVLKDNYVMGTGVNTFQHIFDLVTNKSKVAPHNDFLMIYVDFGVVGSMVFSLIIIRLILMSKQKYAKYVLFYVIGFSLNNPLYYASCLPFLALAAFTRYDSSLQHS